MTLRAVVGGGTGGAGGAAISAGTQSQNTGTVIFSNGGGVSFGLSNGTLTASAQTANPSPMSFSAGTTSNLLPAVVFSNSNGVSFGLNGSTITGSVTQSNQAASAANGSFAFQTVNFSNANGVSFVTSAGSAIAASVATTYLASNASTNYVQANAVFNGTNASGTIASNAISISVAAPGAGGGVALYDGANSITSGTARFTNANGVSFSFNGQTISGSVAAQTNQQLGVYAVSNTTQSTSGTIDARSLSFQGRGIASVGVSNGSVVVSVPSAGASVNFSGGTTSNNLGAITFADSNGVSWGLNGSTMTASVAATSSVSATGFLSISTNGATVSIGAGPLSFFAASNTTQATSGTIDGRSISVQGAGGVSVGVSNGSLVISGGAGAGGSVNFSAGTTSGNLGSVVFSNSNGVSFGLNGSTITASAAVTSQSNQNITAANGGFAFQTLSFSNANGVSFVTSAGSAVAASVKTDYAGTGTSATNASITLNSNGLAISVAAPGGGGAVNFSAGTTSNNLQSVVFSNSNGLAFGLNGSTITGSYTIPGATVFSNSNNVSFGLNGSTVTATATFAQSVDTLGLYALGNTTQNSSTTLDARTLSFNALGAMSWGYSNGSIQVSAPQTSSLVGTSGISISTAGSTITVGQVLISKAYLGGQNVQIAATAQGNSLVSIAPFTIANPLAVSNVRLAANLSVATAANASSAYVDYTFSGVVYSRNGSTLSSVTSGSGTGTASFSSNATGSITGVQELTMTWTPMTLLQGEYWLAAHVSTNSTATGGANTTGLANTFSMILAESISTAALGIRNFGANTNNSQGAFNGMGILSTNATRATIALSDVTVTGTRGQLAQLYGALQNYTV